MFQALKFQISTFAASHHHSLQKILFKPKPRLSIALTSTILRKKTLENLLLPPMYLFRTSTRHLLAANVLLLSMTVAAIGSSDVRPWAGATDVLNVCPSGARADVKTCPSGATDVIQRRSPQLDGDELFVYELNLSRKEKTMRLIQRKSGRSV
ncbi:hypothetical protein F5878DRAFT_150344 [Lentinula raphanica]|uniref:Uncharacterized protein n=1 Tax=Lentinula raphanica TaxID=153919 RepID=A0AA38UHW3_9AGAR|nr:hypothetical protein F5878DRAFT_150344 [Lentinula raphanica]